MALKGSIAAVAAAGLPQEHAMVLGPQVRVEVMGLQDRPELNSATGTVLAFDAAMKRWKVRLDKGGVKMFREGHLRPLAEDMLEIDTPTAAVEEDSARSVPTELVHQPPKVSSSPPLEQSAAASTAASQEDDSLKSMPTNLFREEPGQPTSPERHQGGLADAKQERDNGSPSALDSTEGVAARIGRIENQLSLLFASLNDQQILLDDLVSKDTFDESGTAGQQELRRRIADLEAFREASEKKMMGLGQVQADSSGSGGAAHGASAAAAANLARVEERLRRSDASLRELGLTVGVLQECLDRERILPEAAILPGLHRRRFAAVRAASGWRPGAVAEDLFRQQDVALQVFGFVEPAVVPGVQVLCSASRKAGVLGGLRSAQAAAEAEPRKLRTWERLQAAIRAAEAIGIDEEQVQAANDLLARGQAWRVVQTGNSREVLMEAIRKARQTGFDDSEVQDMEAKANLRIAQLDQINDAKRRLRIAVSWASANNLDKLRKAISEAEELGVEPEEIEKAEREVAGIIAKEAAKEGAPQVGRIIGEGLYDLLRAAKPLWTPRDLDAALLKLAVISVVTVTGLSAALEDQDPDNHLNERLRRAGQKAFTEDTVKALRIALGSQ